MISLRSSSTKHAMCPYSWRCLWCNGYHRRKWTQRHEFKSWMRLIAFHIALIPLGKEHYKDNPLQFTSSMEGLLKFENSQLLNQEKDNTPNHQADLQNSASLFEQLENLLQEIKEQVSYYESHAENLMPERKKQQVRKGEAKSNENILLKIQEKINDMHKRLNLRSRILLDEELQKWIHTQKFYGTDAKTDELIDIQKSCSKILSLIRECMGQIEKFQHITVSPDLRNSFKQLSYELIKKNFIVLEQPPQIMRLNTFMQVSVCLLSDEILKTHCNTSKVKAELISLNDEKTGTLINDSSTMQWDQNQGIATFRKMKLTEMKRSKTPPGNRVTDEIYQMKFSMTIEGEETLNLQVCSLPIVVILNTNQECRAAATILWKTYFDGKTLTPEVSWSDFAQMLRYKFRKDIGVDLKQEHLKYFASKIFGKRFDDFSGLKITCDQFCKTNMVDKKFSFWFWFSATMKFIQSYLLEIYKDDLIYGFVERKEAEIILQDKRRGTFLLRFSETLAGGISVVRKGSKLVSHFDPFTSDKLKNLTVAQIVQDQSHLQYLYPGNHSKEVFKKFMRNPDNDQHLVKLGYTKTLLSYSLECDSDGEESMDDNPSDKNIYSDEKSFYSDTSDKNKFSPNDMEIDLQLPECLFDDDDSF